MSTAQILRAIHALPPSEQWSLLARFGVKPKKATAKPKVVSQSGRTSFDWSELHEGRQCTFGKRQLPNPVLADRDEAPF